MINFNFAISNPWFNTWDRFSILKSYSGLFNKQKAWEVTIYRDITIIGVEFRLEFNCDHAGADLKISLFGYKIEFSFYDTRHWCSENKTWKIYDQVQ